MIDHVTMTAVRDAQARIPLFDGANFDVVVVGASAGGLHAIGTVVGHLPASFPSAVVAVQHLQAQRRSLLGDILARITPLHVVQASDGLLLHPGWLYVGRPDWHVFVDAHGRLHLNQSELEHYVRPSVNPLFASAARSFGPRTLAIILTGTGSDGVEGVQAVRAHGGTIIVQDPATAAFRGMPQAAIQTGSADHILPLADIGPLVLNLMLPPH
jgi:two-component system, chemotaxis family, protein-glutamate methylesterase/glutaminase